MKNSDSRQVLETIILSAMSLIKTDHGFINLVNSEKQIFERSIGFGHYAKGIGKKTKLTEGIAGQVYQTGETVVVEDYQSWPGRLPEPFYDVIHSVVEIPLKQENQVIGLIGLVHLSSDRRFSDTDVDTFNRFAVLASIALNNTRLRQSLQKELAQRKHAEKALLTSEEKYRTIYSAANDAIYIHDMATGEILDVNKKACSLQGYSREEFISQGYRLAGIGDPPYSEAEAHRWLELAISGEPQLFEWKASHKDGHFVWVEVNLKRVSFAGKDRIVAVARDISERKAAEVELARSQENNQALIQAIPDLLFVLDREGIYLRYKGNTEDMYVSEHDILGKSITETLPPAVAAVAMSTIRTAFETRKMQVFEYELKMKGVNEFFEARLAVSGENEVFAICRNVTARKHLETQLIQMSLYDGLTEIYNRAFFEEAMKRYQGMREGKVGVMVCDVDGLKMINDTLGHSMGDQLLKEVANILKNSFRPGDLVARIGGDEFAILLPVNSVKVFMNACKQINQRIEEYNIEHPTVPISLSVGYATNKGVSMDVNALFKEADNNMYREKLHRQKSARSAIVQGMIKALEARDFITEGHSDRLQELVVLFAEMLDLPTSSMPDLRLFARFHDIGKVGIPDHILFKPGSLNEEEWAVMRQHCEIGYRIAISTPDFTPIADWIRMHQEWWNGQGYPLGAMGEAIPIPCRILALADAYDAMTSDRPYRKALGKKAALAEIEKCAGSQFDPKLVPIFCRMLREPRKTQ